MFSSNTKANLKRLTSLRQVTAPVLIGLTALLYLLISLSVATAMPASKTASPHAITLELVPIATGFASPVDIAHAGDDRLFILEQGGIIWVMQPTGTKSEFLNLTSLVSKGSEQGLLGMVFEPSDPSIFYVNYTDTGGDTNIARYRVSSGDPNKADPNSRQLVLLVEQPYTNHNAGDLAFGPDGHLYIPLGDGGDGGDPQDRAQNLNELLGKLLRIHVTGVATYTIPSDNPYANDTAPNTRAEIWAVGLRNPWRFSFDRVTNEIYIGDVGQGAREEIDLLPANTAAQNFGWDCYEGNLDFELTGCAARTSYVFPIFDYVRTDGRAVTGGFVYRGNLYPNMVGHYIFADYTSGNFWDLVRNGQGQWISQKHGALTGNPSTFGEDVNGELYVADLDGVIYRVQDTTVVTPTVPPDLTPMQYLPLIKRES